MGGLIWIRTPWCPTGHGKGGHEDLLPVAPVNSPVKAYAATQIQIRPWTEYGMSYPRLLLIRMSQDTPTKKNTTIYATRALIMIRTVCQGGGAERSFTVPGCVADVEFR
eukprot:111447-Pyramimonas_sp.AAC.1